MLGTSARRNRNQRPFPHICHVQQSVLPKLVITLPRNTTFARVVALVSPSRFVSGFVCTFIIRVCLCRKFQGSCLIFFSFIYPSSVRLLLRAVASFILYSPTLPTLLTLDSSSSHLVQFLSLPFPVEWLRSQVVSH